MNNKEVKQKIIENLLKTIDKKLNKWYNNNCQGELNMDLTLVRIMDDLGRISIPKAIRQALGIDAGGEPMEFYVKDDMIILKKANFE